ncbi:hypothetical protein Plhal304r1_c011g0041951 [Plasmopara halstedii]
MKLTGRQIPHARVTSLDVVYVCHRCKMMLACTLRYRVIVIHVLIKTECE